MRPVEYRNINEEVDLYRPPEGNMTNEDKKILDRITTYPPYKDLNENERFVLWMNRNIAVKNPKLVPRIFSTIDKSDYREVDILEKLILVNYYFTF